MGEEITFAKRLTIFISMCVFSFLCVYASTLIGLNGKVTLWIISSLAMCVIVMECGKGTAIVAYLLLTMISFALIDSDRIRSMYICIFAVYPIIKSAIEYRASLVRTLLYKAASFAVLMFIAVCMMRIFDFKTYLYIFVVIAGMVYDFLLSLFINIYNYYKMKISGIDPLAENQ